MDSDCDPFDSSDDETGDSDNVPPDSPSSISEPSSIVPSSILISSDGSDFSDPEIEPISDS